MVAVTGAVPVFLAVNEGRLPLPEDANPIGALLFTHEKATVPPVAGLLKITGLVEALLQAV